MQRRIVWFILVIYLLGCSEVEYPHKFPIALTDEVTNINAQGAQFEGRIENLGSHKIVAYGFVWEQGVDPTINSSKLSLATNIQEGKFSQTIQNDLVADKVYYVRAFIQTDKLIVYGDSKPFASLGSLPPVISSFSPGEGMDGSEITITGDNFSTKSGGNLVTIGPLTCEIISISKTTIVVKLPVSEMVGPFPITVEVAGRAVTSTGTFLIKGPIIKSISAQHGRVGDVLTMEGEFFDEADYMEMIFGAPSWGNYAPVHKISGNKIECRIPDYAGGTGKLKLQSSFHDSYKSFEYPNDFTILDSWSKRFENTPIPDYMGYVSAQINNVTYIIGGRSLYAYNVASGSWTMKQDFPGDYRFFGTAFTFNGKLYYGFGEGHHEPYRGANWQHYNDLWSYDPATNTWTSLGNTPLSARSRAVAVIINNKIYVGFGGVINPSVASVGDLWQYNVAGNTWSEVNTTGVQGNFAPDPTAFSAGNKGYFVNLHYSDASYVSVLWEFDPALSTWTRKSDLNDWVTGGPSATMGVGGNGLVICYANSIPRIYEYDNAKDLWVKRQSLHAYFAPIKFASFYQGKLTLGGSQVWELTFD